MGSKKKSSVSLGNIKINDNFWNRYIRLVKEAIIPYQWNILNDRVPEAEPSYCIRNFKIAAGELEGEFGGAVFQDTDVAKWLEAVAYTLAAERDQELEKLADETIALIGRAQQKDGYLNTYYTIKEPTRRWSNLKEGHELYTAGHMIEAAVAYYEATGKDEFLKIVSRFADLICEKFGPDEGQCHGYPGHQEIELALVKLSKVTGKKEYVRLAKYFIDQRGVGDNYFLEEEKRDDYVQIFPEFKNYDPKYSQSHLPVREQLTAEGHAVRAVYMCCAMADLAYEFQDDGLMKSCETLWNNMTKKRMFITGGIGSSGLLERFTTDYDLPNDRNYAETCASIGLALFGRRMAEITGDSSYMDVVEKELYNTLLSGIALDGKSFFYVNPLAVWPNNCLERTSLEHVKAVRQKWFGVACCPPNIARTLASLGQYIYSQNENSLFVNLYIANEAKIELGEKEFQIKLDNHYPQSGSITVEITGEDTDREVTLGFRIPEYAKEFQITRNGELLKNLDVEKGYVLIKSCCVKEAIQISYKEEARFVRANPLVRADSGKVAITKGPFVYCVEETDNMSNLPAVYVDTSQELKEQYEAKLLGGVTTIRLRGKKISEKNWKENELYKTGNLELEEVELKAVPYGLWGNRKTGEMLVWLKEAL
ncbi:glycoside hydrolase family 127 protein [Konateibacter massiliensis]|uniref:glycoside hydrolase family 127 protein n=1 Tax=Konateibacter massiliensis TaxID=2002841 RepID=UPI000C155D45|nr:beta-L-arabinofuranosidase domain-containing protein [Konateibacter massiliensis]